MNSESLQSSEENGLQRKKMDPENQLDSKKTLPEASEEIDVAPNWKLVWWRFKKHRLAVISGWILIIIALIALFPNFFSTQNEILHTSSGDSFFP